MKKIAFLTRGCIEINSAIRAIIRTAKHFNIEVIGVLRANYLNIYLNNFYIIVYQNRLLHEVL